MSSTTSTSSTSSTTATLWLTAEAIEEQVEILGLEEIVAPERYAELFELACEQLGITLELVSAHEQGRDDADDEAAQVKLWDAADDLATVMARGEA